MVRLLDPGEKVKNYKILQQVHTGGLAISYKAEDSAGELVFLKQYKSPSIRKPWYRDYVEYQKSMKARIEGSSFKNFTYRLIEFFEFDARPRCYFQVFEFVKSESLEGYLARAKSSPAILPWERRLTMSQVMLGGIKFMHQTKIVHSDLKPANVILMPVDGGGYRLKLIDMDFSLLTDRRAPWHGDVGYFGTPGYMSPEHKQGEIPLPASDVFTCGLILYELLAGKSAFAYTDDDYTRAILEYRASPPKLLGPMPAGNDTEVISLIHRALDPSTRNRPEAAELHIALCRRDTASGSGAASAREATAPSTLSPASAVSTPSESPPATTPHADHPVHVPESRPTDRPPLAGSAERILLTSEAGELGSFGVSTAIGRRVCRRLGDDAQFLSEPQFHLERSASGWSVLPAVDATNETLLNGQRITEQTPLTEGDQIAVGRQEKGVIKLPLTVRFVTP